MQLYLSEILHAVTVAFLTSFSEPERWPYTLLGLFFHLQAAMSLGAANAHSFQEFD